MNPGAHGGRAGARASDIRSAVSSRGLDATFYRTTGPGDAVTAVASLAPGAFDAVVSVGGDGTLFEIVNGLMALAADQRPMLGILPVGTGNAFARDLGLAPGDWQRALEGIARGKTLAVDVGEARREVTDSSSPGERFWFINMIGCGFVVDAARAAARLKRLGRSAYTLGALATLVALPRYPLEIEVDGQALGVEDFLFLEVANSRYTGTRFLMAPDAKFDDGVFDIVLVRALPRRRALKLFPTIYDGRHVDVPEVRVIRARELIVRGQSGLPFMADGEFQGATPLVLRCHSGALRVFTAPARSAGD